MASLRKKNLDSPDEVRSFDNGKVEIANLRDVAIGRERLNLDGVGKNVLSQ